MTVEPLFLNVGSGNHPLPGFLNIDVVPQADLRHDLSKGLPFSDGTVDGVFSEHFLEHLTQAQGLAFLRECRRVLKPGGVARIAMPDLDELVRRYGSTDWRGDGDMFKLGWHWVDNRCEMLNIGMREWGHQWVYNEEELRLAGQRAGLSARERMPWGESNIEKFRGLEYRPGSKLVMEFEKPRRDHGSRPLVSLLIPAYNPRFFEQALKTALAQTYENLEILISDDCRGPEIENIVKRVASADRRVSYERNPEKQGGWKNYVRCFERARGEFIKFLNDDDRLAPNCVERMTRVLASDPEVTLVTSRRRRIDEQGAPLRDDWHTKKASDLDCVFEGTAYAACLLKYGNCVGEPSTTMFRKEDLAWVRPHIITFGGEFFLGSGDSAMWMNLLGRGDIAYLAETLSEFRIHGGQRQCEQHIAEAAPRSFDQLRTHGRRLGFFEHTRAPYVNVRPMASNQWERRRFRLAPLIEVKRLSAKSLKRRAARIVTKRIRDPLRRISRRWFDAV
jgi:predicted SAM-dependent methyltransferase